jgi:hypothetical protein
MGAMSPNTLALLKAVRYCTRSRLAYYRSPRCPLYMQDRGTLESDYFSALELVRRGLAY